MKNLEFDIHAVDDLLWWSINDKRLVTKILKLIIDLDKHTFKGLGKPEPLKGNLQGL
jgi:toxin YoeB